MRIVIIERNELPTDCIADCSQPGRPADGAVAYWLKDERVAAVLDRASPDEIRTCLDGYGAWDEGELNDDGANRSRLLWLMCCDFAERKDEDFCVE